MRLLDFFSFMNGTVCTGDDVWRMASSTSRAQVQVQVERVERRDRRVTVTILANPAKPVSAYLRTPVGPYPNMGTWHRSL